MNSLMMNGFMIMITIGKTGNINLTNVKRMTGVVRFFV